VILLHTRVVSELLRPAPDARVTQWIDAQALETLFLSAITVAELRAAGSPRSREPSVLAQPAKEAKMNKNVNSVRSVILLTPGPMADAAAFNTPPMCRETANCCRGRCGQNRRSFLPRR
jgi:hypothetical protein